MFSYVFGFLTISVGKVGELYMAIYCHIYIVYGELAYPTSYGVSVGEVFMVDRSIVFLGCINPLMYHMSKRGKASAIDHYQP